jgi:hypothetical protein
LDLNVLDLSIIIIFKVAFNLLDYIFLDLNVLDLNVIIIFKLAF